MEDNPPEGCWAKIVGDENLYTWECEIQGPENTPYNGGYFLLTIEFPEKFPEVPPNDENSNLSSQH